MSAILAAAAPVEHAVLPLLKRVALRYLPLLFLLYVVATIDRVKGVGAALGVIFLAGTVAMALVGRLADRAGPRETLLVAMLAPSFKKPR